MRQCCKGNSLFRLTLIVVVSLLANGLAQANASDEDRANQLAAREYTQALLAGETQPYPALALNDHPAMPWLKMHWMRSHLDELEADQVIRFISRHRNRPFAASFRRDWLLAMGRAERWSDFDRHYRGERDQALQCLHLRSRLARDDETVLRQAAALWLTGRQLPGECQALFDAAQDSGHITDYMIAERFRLALNQDNLGLATRLAPKVGDAAIARVDRLRTIQENPRNLIENIEPADTDEGEVADFTQAIKRLARRDPLDAHQYWETAREAGLAASSRQRFMVQRRIALEAARQHLPEASEWLAASSANDEFIRAWRIRHAIRFGEWDKALVAIDSQPGDQSRQWQYWRARALAEVGRGSEAEAIYRRLASSNHYYGILSKLRLGQSLSPREDTIEPDESVLAELRGKPELQLSRELLDLGWETAARMEWRAALEGSNNARRCQAALLAHDWGWDAEAVRLAARSGCRGDPRLDYPLAFHDYMSGYSEQFALDPAWAWSIMRAESLFAVGAESHVGALGLMQLMPGTAREVAQRLDMPLNGTRDIIEPAHNIRLGTGYLRQMLDRFDGHPLLATAAYNAGPHRARAWLPESGYLAADVWAETVPFRETRRYIRRVMTHSLGFDRQLGRPIGKGEAFGLRLAPVGDPDVQPCLLAEVTLQQDDHEELPASC